jgi:hypothetical protein
MNELKIKQKVLNLKIFTVSDSRLIDYVSYCHIVIV